MAKTLSGAITKPIKSKPAPKRDGERQPALLIQVEPDDPIVGCVHNMAGLIEVDQVSLDSPAVRRLKAEDIHVAAPLSLHGKLVGLLNLGPRLYEQDLSQQDRVLLMMLANQAVSATRVAEWLRNHPGDSPTREGLYQDLHIARLIQEALQPRQAPRFAGWQVHSYAQPAEIVGGDFMDLIELPDRRVAVLFGDVCNTGIPAALVMAIARSILRSAAREYVAPQRVLRLANELLTPEIPKNMLVTCFYAVIQPDSGLIQYANAGHTLPLWLHPGEVTELRASGMPLGLMAGMEYETKEVTLRPGETLLFYSDGFSEARAAGSAQRERAGTQRVREWARMAGAGEQLISGVLDGLHAFGGPEREQEDDLTLLALERLAAPGEPALASQREVRQLARFEMPSEPGNERLAADKVVEEVRALDVSGLQIERLRTAVAETALNAMEHGNHYQKERPTTIQVDRSENQLVVRVTDSGGGRPIPSHTHPDLQAKLAGLQSPRGWGLFLIRNMVDEMHITSGETYLTVDLVFSLKGEPHAS